MYNINSINKAPGTVLLPVDKNNRTIYTYYLSDCVFANNSNMYPDVKLYSYETDRVYSPVDETIMSLKNISSEAELNFTPKLYNQYKEEPQTVFYFIYNTDNYFHFIYDTLPYLISYLELRKKMNIKLLMNYSNPQTKSFYKFVSEFLSLIGVSDSEILIADSTKVYKKVLISNSFTHGIDSNFPPREEIYEFYKSLVSKISLNESSPKKVYISRRSWMHNDVSNIGTNYTTRRKLENEDALVEFLKTKGYTEVFTELMSTEEKINLFYNATDIIGAIGGGLCNVLFSKPECNLLSICSPEFLSVNTRFLFTFQKINYKLFTDTYHVSFDKFKKFMRVKYKNIVGEIVDVNENYIQIMYVDESVAGWNSEMEYKYVTAPLSECIALDNGLNSSWNFNLENFKKIV